MKEKRNSSGKTLSPTTKTALLIWAITTSFHLYQFIFRNSPAVLGDVFARDLHMSAAMLGAFASMYYWAYSPLQVVMGLLIDNFGPKKIALLGLSLCMIGVFILGVAHNVFIACFGRFLIGAGAASSFLAPIRLSTIWFSKNHLAFAISMVSASGKVGGALSGVFLLGFVGLFSSWRAAFIVLGAVFIILFFAVWRFVRDTPEGRFVAPSGKISFHSIARQLKTVFSSPAIWMVGIYGYSMYLPISVFSDMWGPSFVKTLHGVAMEEASKTTSLVLIGSCIGAPAVAYISDRIKKRVICLKASVVASLLIASSLFFFEHSLMTTYILVTLFGACCSGQILIFAIGTELMPKKLSGTATGIVNMINMAGGALHAPLIGKILDVMWSGAIDPNGAPVRSISDYRWAMSTVVVCIIIAGVLTFFIPETYGGARKKGKIFSE
ncbi:MFS transporter [Candidatus Hydrogenosomobacter endosymbioticus]|uniref:Lysosomal dipeptide transporter MFSD1 n=1 Tax=Candidatus Hydrogenosomobacter endosymbioticus TaxID=2558174 RepID=A0ABM7V973_9PROT|nr:MFS transporter [Candidatus Hydrogenosomobacter endosymbioticus]BDB96344.1 MFS transporter [Candidatus Hydrogenosomobacter endosymbioticus]